MTDSCLLGKSFDSEIASEAGMLSNGSYHRVYIINDNGLVYAAVNLLSMYHDQILENSLFVRSTPQQEKHPRQICLEQLCAKPRYRGWATALVIIQHLQVLRELLALRQGQRRWRIVILLELAKYVEGGLQLCLLTRE